MAEATSFQENVINKSNSFADELLASTPELKSISVVFEWNLPENVRGNLQTGIVRTPDKKISLSRAYDILKVISEFGKYLHGLAQHIISTEREYINNAKATHTVSPIVNQDTIVKTKKPRKKKSKAAPVKG